MEKRLGVVAVIVTDSNSVSRLNQIFADYGDIILGRQGLPFKEKGVHIISLIVEGTTDQISALTGKIGKLEAIQVRSVLTKFKESKDEQKNS